MSKRTKVVTENKADVHPFNQLWINSAYQQTLLPNAPWHKLEDEISHNLAQKAEKQFGNPQRKEMLLEVLGNYFVEKYLPHVQRNIELLNQLSFDERNHLKTDAERWLNVQMYKAVKQTGHGYILTGIGPGEPPPVGIYADFLRETFSIFTTGLDRELFIQEKILATTKAIELCRQKKPSQPDIYKVPAPSRLKPVDSEFFGSSQPTAKHLVGHYKADNIDPPPLWGPQSDLVGSAVVSLLERDPRKFEVVVGRLHGRQLPGHLRSYIWADVLFKAERKRNKETYIEKVVRERFALAVARGLTELRIQKPTQSPINGLIQNAVIETYSKTVSMISYKHMEHMKETVRALNVLYVYDRSYEPYLVHWLFPLQLAFRNKQAMADDKGEHILELAMYLDMLNSHCFPSWPHVFAMAEQVMMTLHQHDPALHDHLRHIAPINAQVNPKEFLVQLLYEEREKAEALLQTTSTNTPRAPTTTTQFLTDPTIFLRRWIGEAFVTVLDTPGVMYIWDQIFMQSWQQTAIINVCLSLMELLRHRFMEAHDYNTMKEVFLMEPCKLYTADFQMAWIHVENGKDLLDINDLCNRQRFMTPVSHLSEDLMSERDTPVIGALKPCGIKNIRTHLTVPADSIQKDPRLASIKPENLRLSIGIYFGSILMRSRLSHSLPVTSVHSQDSYGSVITEFEFLAERYIYDALDISQYDVERELGAYPYAIFKLEHLKEKSGRKSDTVPITLGWARIPLYRQSNHQDLQPFSLIIGDVTVPLHPGALPESFISTQPQTPTEEDRDEGSLIGYSCTFSAHVFDPLNEPPSRKVTPYKPEPVAIPVVPPVENRVTPVIKKPTARRQPSVSKLPAEPAPKIAPKKSKPVEIDPWILFKPEATKSDPKHTTNRDPFVLYIDSVHCVPDSATIVKVTGRILRAGSLTNLQDILAVPDLDSSARSPKFNFSMLVNEGRLAADPELLLFLRVYTFDIETKKVVVIGSSLVPVFKPGSRKGEGLLNVGGHQLRLYSGMPNMTEGLNQINAAALDNNPVIPACSLLIRLLPETQNLVPAPNYSTGYYKSEGCKPTASELKIHASYAADNLTRPKTERDTVIRLQRFETPDSAGGTDAQLSAWLLNKLDIKKQQGANLPAGNLVLYRCICYRVKVGLRVQIKAAFGLPDDLYIQCFAYVATGKQAKYITATDEGYGKEEKFITTRISPTSHITAPVWEDPSKEFHPFYDSNSCLIIQLIGLKVKYQPQSNHKSAGSVSAPDGRSLEIGKNEMIGWTLVPLFEGNSVISGTHIVPVLTRPVDEETVEDLSQKTVSQFLSQASWNSRTKMSGASVHVMLWDGHFDFHELPKMEDHKSLLGIVGDPDQYLSIIKAPPSSITQQELVLGMMDDKVRKEGINGSTLRKEVDFFSDTVAKKFTHLMTEYCSHNGFAPL